MLKTFGRLAAATVFFVLAVYVSRGWWLPALGRTLVCAEGQPAAPTVILDNFDDAFGLFKRGAELERAGAVQRVLVPVTAAGDDGGIVAREVAATLARVAGLSRWEAIPILEQEPISLNAALRVRDFLVTERISSVTLVSNPFRSRRSEIIYRSVLSDRGITMTCMPVFGGTNRDAWTTTWHGLANMTEQFLKLQYYRFWVMPTRRG